MISLETQVVKMTKALEEKKNIDEILLSEIVKSLIESELQPGGPYLFNGHLNLLLNARILKLFALLNKPLPNVSQFIDNSIEIQHGSIREKVVQILKEVNDIKHNKKSVDTNFNVDGYYNFFSSYFNMLSPEIRQSTVLTGEKVISMDRLGEITKLSLLFSESITYIHKMSLGELKILGHANFMVWISYSLYDSVFDNDMGSDAVPAANIFMRKALELYIKSHVDYNLAIDYMFKVDTANSWEMAHCRFKIDSENIIIESIPGNMNMEKLLENRAIAHIIGPLSIAKKYGVKNSDLKKIEKALKMYCIARQLNDDLHDWVEDFENGRMTYVLAELFRKAKVPIGSSDAQFILKRLKTIFYDSELERICLVTESYIDKSIQLLNTVDIIANNNEFIKLFIQPIKSSVSKAAEQHRMNKKSISLMYD